MGAFDNAMQSVRDKAMGDDHAKMTDSSLVETGWERATNNWSSYPIGTKARESWGGGYWTKMNSGWKYIHGDTFPYPGCSDQVMLPQPNNR